MIDVPSKLVYIQYNVDGLYLFHANKGMSDHSRRCIMRMIFILIDSYCKYIGNFKNTLWKNNKISTKTRKAVQEEVEDFTRNWNGKYDTIRDKFAAHNQCLGGLDAFEWWNDIDYTTITIFYEQMRTIQTILAQDIAWKPMIAADYEEIDFSNSLLREVADNEYYISLDRLAITKKNTSGAIPLNDFQDKCMLLLSVIDFLFIDLSLTAMTDNPNKYYKKILFDNGWLLACCDICSLLDGLYNTDNHGKSLVDLSPNDWKGLAILNAGENDRDVNFEACVREIRNKLAAHIDTAMTLESLIAMFDSLNLRQLQMYITKFMNIFKEACFADIRTKQYALLNERLPAEVIGLSHSLHRSSI